VLGAPAAGNVHTVVVNPAYVYFTTSASVYTCPLAGCFGGIAPPIYTASNSALGGLIFGSSINDVAVADQNNSLVFDISSAGALNWTTDSTVFNQPAGLTTDGTNIYAGEYAGSIAYVPKGGGAVNLLCTFGTHFVAKVAYDPGTKSVFGAVRDASGGGYVIQCTVPSGTLTTFGPLEPAVWDIAVVGSNVYYVIGGTAPGYADGGLFVSPDTALTSRTALATGSAYGQAIAMTADQSNVYFFSGGGRAIYRCALGGCGGAPTAIATGVYGIVTMTNDANAIYWGLGTTPNTVVKLAK
jgi:hypothetical protein